MKMPTEEELDRIQQLTNQINDLRVVLRDRVSPANLIQKPWGHRQSTFERRIAKLKRLEIRRLEILGQFIDGVMEGSADEIAQ